MKKLIIVILGLSLGACSDNASKATPESNPKQEIPREIGVSSEWLYHYDRLTVFIDKKTDRRILHYRGAMVVLPECSHNSTVE